VKRSRELAGLSRDHHRALEAALRLRRTTADDVEATVPGFLVFWRDYGEHHFQVEEKVLLGALPEDDREWEAAARRIRDEHGELRARVAALADAPAVDRAHDVGERLTAHVRFEEREAFPLLEQRLSAAALRRLGDELDASTGR
jgi:hemerythrin-like domain-containing protein